MHPFQKDSALTGTPLRFCAGFARSGWYLLDLGLGIWGGFPNVRSGSYGKYPEA